VAEEKIYLAIVQGIEPVGHRGPYAIAKSEELGSITFSLNEPVWREKDWPENGTWVALEQLIKKRAGWRAQQGRFMKPSDQPTTARSI